jgi:AraC-like DNA-binding protein
MQAACSLLSKAHSVKDAAYTLHFKHSSHFCREFQRRYGMTPSQFARASAMPCSILFDRPLDSGSSCLTQHMRSNVAATDGIRLRKVVDRTKHLQGVFSFESIRSRCCA